jgi:hypothetical protein
MSTQAFTYHEAERRELTLSHAPKGGRADP